MNFIILLLAIALVFIFGLALPYVSNIGSYNVKQNSTNNKKHMKFKLNVDNEKTLNKNSDNKNLGAKAVQAQKYSNDPNEFDFDVDELIQEEQDEERNETLKFRQKVANRKSQYIEEIA